MVWWCGGVVVWWWWSERACTCVHVCVPKRGGEEKGAELRRVQTLSFWRAGPCTVQITGKRGIILGGWAKLNIGMLDAVKDKELIDYCKDNILFTSKANHIQLFPRCCATVTHAGMGETNAPASRPTFLRPCPPPLATVSAH